MSTFERSPDGIANRALFLDADYVAYHEGSEDDAFSLDMLFWSNLAERLKPGINIRFLPSGSKSDITQMADSFDSVPSNTLFLLDRDYDDVIGVIRQDRNIIYTYGYSFENDLARQDNIIKFLKENFPLRDIEEISEREIGSYIEENMGSFESIARFDQLSRFHDVAGIATANFQRLYSDPALGSQPDISPEVIETEICRVVSSIEGERGEVSDLDWSRRLNGHFLLDIFYRLTTRIGRKFDPRFKIDKKFFCRALITLHFKDFPTNGDVRSDYYATTFDHV
ncbi:DUF4435 domain-containing protein [Sinorhizobium saheli]|uniref:DUF4435 domain-containing protein n=1 Tax=Sinorhizobium saheli TaxID=36856 RepID=UPI000A06CA02|nr:DUF4435 domain-containing protein [Sinorhizobium saheli]MQW88219.1 DUF4435 domain-containing protein [Sinorhizobium saheli]